MLVTPCFKVYIMALLFFIPETSSDRHALSLSKSSSFSTNLSRNRSVPEQCQKMGRNLYERSAMPKHAFKIRGVSQLRSPPWYILSISFCADTPCGNTASPRLAMEQGRAQHLVLCVDPPFSAPSAVAPIDDATPEAKSLRRGDVMISGYAW